MAVVTVSAIHLGRVGRSPGTRKRRSLQTVPPLALSAVPDPCSVGVSLGVWGTKRSQSPPLSNFSVHHSPHHQTGDLGRGVSSRPLFCRRKIETWTRALTLPRSQSWKVREGQTHTLQPVPGPMYPLRARLPWDTESTPRKHGTLLSFKYLKVKEREVLAFSVPATCKLDTGD